MREKRYNINNNNIIIIGNYNINYNNYIKISHHDININSTKYLFNKTIKY